MSWESPLKGKPVAPAHANHPVWAEISEYFSPAEFNNPHDMDVEYLRLLLCIRKEAGVPMRLISDARPVDGSTGADKSAHKKRPCRAADFQVRNSYERARLVMAAIRCGVVRVGIYPGNHNDGGSVHLDAETHFDNPSPRMWTQW